MPARSVAYVFTGNFSNLTAGLTVASRNVSELGTKLTALDKGGRQMRAGLTTLGGAAGKFGLVAAAGFAVAIGAAAKFDQAMSKVQAATHETAGNMALLRDAAIKAGAATKYSASEAAEGIEALAKAGVSTADILDGGLTGALNLAAAGGQSVAEAAETAATTLTQFKLAGDQTSHVADVLAAAAGKAQGEVSDMAAALKYVGPVAAQMGISLEETAGTIAELASQGIVGEQAGTSLRGMLTSLTSPSKVAAEEMEALGISMYDASGKFVGLDGIAGQLQESMSGLSAAERDQALGRIFGNEQITAARILYSGGAADVQKWTKAVDDQGYAAETAAIKMDNLAGDFEQFKGSLETALIGAGSGGQGPLRSLVQDATSVVNAFNKLPPSAQSATTALAGITAVVGGGLWFGSKVVGGIASTKDALEQLGVSGTKASKALKIAGSAAAGLTVLFAVGTAVDALWKSSDRAVPGVEALTKSLLGLGNAQAAKNLQDQIGDIGDAMKTIDDPGFWADAQGKVDSLFGDQLGSALTVGAFSSKLQSSKQEVREAADAIDVLDKALANIVATGSPEQAAAAFADMADAQGLSVDQQDKLLDQLPQYKEALDGAANATTLAAGATTDYGTSARTAEVATAQLDEAISKSRESATKQAQAFFTLGDSLNDSKASLSDWIRDLREQADALRNFRVNAEQAADKGLRKGLIKALQEAGPEGAMRMRQLANATKGEIDKANGAWQSGQREIRKYTDAVGGVPSTAGTTVSVKTFDAMTAIARLKIALAQVKSKDVNVNVHYRNIGNKLAGMAAANQADGGFVPKTGLPYADRHHYLLADGEGVTTNRNGETDRFRDVVGGINAGLSRSQIKGMLADGGFAGSGFSSSTVARPGSVSDAVAAIVELRGSIRGWTADIRESDKAIKRETRERDRAAAIVEKNQAEVDRLTGLYNSLSQSIQSSLAANQFDQGDPWKSGGGFEGILSALSTSTANANAMTEATGTLSGSLTGAALQSVLEQGLQTTQMFAGLTPEQLAQYQAEFDANSTAVTAAGNAGGGAVYGQDMEKANQILAASQAELARQTFELQTANQMHAIAERQRDRDSKYLSQMKDILGDLRDEAKKARGEQHSGTRSKR